MENYEHVNNKNKKIQVNNINRLIIVRYEKYLA